MPRSTSAFHRSENGEALLGPLFAPCARLAAGFRLGRMRIGLDISSAGPTRTGIGTYAWELARHLAAGDERHEWVLLFNSLRQPTPHDPAFASPRVTLRRTRLPGPALLWAWRRFDWPPVEVLAGGACSVFHSPSTFIPPQRDGARVTTVHDLDFLYEPLGTLDALGAGYIREALERHLSAMDAVIAVSRLVAGQIVEAFGQRVPGLEERVHVVPHGVTEHFWQAADRAADARCRAIIGVPESGYILYVGSRRPRKNLPVLLEAWRMLAADTASGRLPLVVAGPPHERGGASLGPLADGLIEKPYVSDLLLPALYRGARVLVMPSRFEGFGLPIVEAMASGVPVVATRAAGAFDFLPPETALFVEPGDAVALAAALQKSLEGGPCIENMVQRAREAVADLTWERTASETLRVYEVAYRHARTFSRRKR